MQSFFRSGSNGFKLHQKMPRGPSGAILFISSHYNKQQYTLIHQQLLQELQPKSLIGGIVDSINNKKGWALVCFKDCFGAHHFTAGISKRKQVGRWPTSISKPEFTTKSKFESISQPSEHTLYEKPIGWPSNASVFAITDQSPHDAFKFMNSEFLGDKVLLLIGGDYWIKDSFY